MTEELTSRLNRNEDVLNQFYRSFGLDPDLLYDVRDRRRNIGKFFPDTPITLLKEVFEALKLYDFAEFLEKATKRRTLRPALPLKEIEKLSNVSNHPTKVYSKAKVLIVGFGEASPTFENYDVETAGSFFRSQNSRNEVTTFFPTASYKEMAADLDKLSRSKSKDEINDRKARGREQDLKMLLENKISDSYNKWKRRREELELFGPDDFDDEYNWGHEDTIVRQHEATFSTKTDEQLLSVFYNEEPQMKNELKGLTEKIEKWNNERKPLIEKQIKQKEEELKKEIEKFEITVLSVIDEWIEVLPYDKGKRCNTTRKYFGALRQHPFSIF